MLYRLVLPWYCWTASTGNLDDECFFSAASMSLIFSNVVGIKTWAMIESLVDGLKKAESKMHRYNEI